MMRKDQESAVSPTIATVLILMMTVVAVAVVAAVAMGLAGGEPDYVVGLTVKAAPAGNDAVVTLYGSRNLPDLVRVEVIDAGSSAGEFVEAWNGTAGTAPAGIPLTAENAARPVKEMHAYTTKLWVKGTFADGTEQVLLMQTVTFMDVQPEDGGDEGEKTLEFQYNSDIKMTIWSESVFNNMKDNPGSDGNELFKFEDDNYIYFKSNSHGSFGGQVNYADINTLSKFWDKWTDKSSTTKIENLNQKIQEANLNRCENPPSSPSPAIGSIYINKNGEVKALIKQYSDDTKGEWKVIGTVSES
ncbi:MAG: hypothetical protein O0V67_00865 [Methanocorpusculum sp.]|nr:hypothetical protein [Methanocorpusculum sp.]